MQPDETGTDETTSETSPPPGKGPGLTLVATPIGNLGDLAPRALAVLRAADVVLCEDTRVTAPMLARHGVSVSLLPLHEHNEDAATPKLVARMAGGQRLALVSDAGTPLMSDPGYRLVRAAIAEGITVSAVPGPNASVMALTLSGLPPHPHLFHGFLPPRDAARAAELARFRAMERAGLSATLIFYEAPHRLGDTLAGMAEVLGPERPAAVARELTKRFEEVRRGTLAELAAHYATHQARGEIVLLVGPPGEDVPEAEASLDDRLRAALAGGESLRDAAALVAAATGLPRKQVYARALEMKSEQG
ncbi:16S rRNA (cytidine(1402)-2'-O)-methyltransferase [Pseudoroseomonas deserti]|uniref:Ribosomal RNA small subunit methyltransferase I n=1 Tax=Teichococcus deserti TaxID=1817963 RepID=A0A1V2GXB1_9PROT|nr:16S rRNA (cytidine(1402)-2'-O)-methyltransferase [Pseudoroseomonas deserti]ONG47872.1 16S rRNA (cytidine(1402)-2'-O)-methyltransferase [Pseudoroseomonas deserti]